MINVNKRSVKLEGSAVTLLAEWSLLTDKLYTLGNCEHLLQSIITEQLINDNNI